MSDTYRPIGGYPDCRICGSVVDSLTIKGQEVAMPKVYVWTTTALEAPHWYTVTPCGHRVRGFAQNSNSIVVRWLE